MAKKKIHNIIRFERVTSGPTTTDYKGIVSAELNVDEGDFTPNNDEGGLYPVGLDNIGTPGRFPVTGQITMEDVAKFMTLLTAAVGDMKIIGKAGGAAANALFTIENQLFERGTLTLSRFRDARAVLQLLAYSDDGTVHPFSEADSADTAAPSSAKVKTNNIVSIVHDALPATGVLGVTFNVMRGKWEPDFDEGELYPIGADLHGVGENEYPVTGSVNFESMDAVDFVGNGVDDLVVTAKAAQSAANQVITASNVQFRRARGQVQRRQDGSVDLEFVAYASSASTLPLSIAGA